MTPEQIIRVVKEEREVWVVETDYLSCKYWSVLPAGLIRRDGAVKMIDCNDRAYDLRDLYMTEAEAVTAIALHWTKKAIEFLPMPKSGDELKEKGE